MEDCDGNPVAIGHTFSTNQVAWFYDSVGRLTKETCGSTAAGLNDAAQVVFMQ